MTNSDLPMMPWFPQDFLGATMGWTFAERSAYRALLDQQWVLRALPTDESRLARLAQMEPVEFAAVWPIVQTKFVSTAAGLVNSRLERHRKESLRRKESFQRAANSTNAKRRAKHAPGDREDCSTRNATRDARRDAISISSSSLLSGESESDSSARAREGESFHVEQPGAEAWKDTAGLNVDAFDSYLNHVAILVREGRVRAQLPPHSRLEQARWLAMQGNHSRQLDIVTRAIRNGWKALQNESEKRNASRSRFDDTHAQAGEG